ncbi:4326_t:CDS:2 [Funneliformis geosporum]|uniref:4326_t:CDS:1 n=1 Tax=Funneliformis geosporum TaxID=1117311 RepID=A0A9W4SHB4_9GLOM|nr:4326_t:CDS:2 [Funneliformis geosporum]
MDNNNNDLLYKSTKEVISFEIHVHHGIPIPNSITSSVKFQTYFNKRENIPNYAMPCPLSAIAATLCTKIVKERSQHKQDLQKFWKGQSKSVKKKINLPSAIPPPINYSDLDKSTTTTKSFTARTPSPVKKLTHQFDDNIKSYPRPTFKSYDKSYDISNEEAVRGALKNNSASLITTSRQPM